ncbi:MAG: ComF family protein [Nitrospirales bacterium]
MVFVREPRARMLTLGAISRRALHTLLPVSCASCAIVLTDDPVPFFCRRCWETVRPLSHPQCPRCGRPFASSIALQFSPTHLCGECRKRRPAYTRARSLYAYEGTLRDAIRLFKYRGKVALSAALGALMKEICGDMEGLDLVMPVPLHAVRLREREFNQALLLADQVSRWHGLRLSYKNLIRVRATAPQTTLSRARRRKNLRRSFALRDPTEVSGRRVLLMDDVFTTGTTVNECAKALRKAGSSDVYVLTLARTV